MPVSKLEREDGWRAAPVPNDHQAAVLRRVARGHMVATVEKGDDGKEEWSFAYDDDTPIRDKRGFPLAEREFHRMVKSGWLIKIEGKENVYRARTAADPLLPTIFKQQKPQRAAKRAKGGADASEVA